MRDSARYMKERYNKAISTANSQSVSLIKKTKLSFNFKTKSNKETTSNWKLLYPPNPYWILYKNYRA